MSKVKAWGCVGFRRQVGFVSASCLVPAQGGAGRAPQKLLVPEEHRDDTGGLRECQTGRGTPHSGARGPAWLLTPPSRPGQD